MSKGNRKNYDYDEHNYTLAEIDAEIRCDEKQALARYRQIVESRKQNKTTCDNLLYFLN